MIAFRDASRRVTDRCGPLPSERCSVVAAAGRFLAEPLVARHDSPRFDGSAVDGYGIAGLNDGPHRLVGRAEANAPFSGCLGAGECVRILTGALVPAGVEAIVMQEDCRLEGERVFASRSAQRGDHVRRQGEEYRAGATLLPPGTLVTPSVIGLATAQGEAWLRVGGAPTVAILATGNELRQPGEALGSGGVYASNVSTLHAAVQAMGLRAETRVLRDDPCALRDALASAFETADLVLTTGGVSVGDRDHVRDCARELGVEEAFWKVAMKPGKPVFFGTRAGKPMLGLPGNPVAATVAFELFARPALLRLMGAAEVGPPTFPARLAAPLRKRIGITEFVRVRLRIEADGVVATPTSGQGSHMIGGMAAAEGLLHLPEERDAFGAGEILPASFLKWSLL